MSANKYYVFVWHLAKKMASLVAIEIMTLYQKYLAEKWLSIYLTS